MCVMIIVITERFDCIIVDKCWQSADISWFSKGQYDLSTPSGDADMTG